MSGCGRSDTTKKAQWQACKREWVKADGQHPRQDVQTSPPEPPTAAGAVQAAAARAPLQACTLALVLPAAAGAA